MRFFIITDIEVLDIFFKEKNSLLLSNQSFPFNAFFLAGNLPKNVPTLNQAGSYFLKILVPIIYILWIQFFSSKLNGKVGVISWLFFHLIRSSYVLYRYFDCKKLNCGFFHKKHHKITFRVEV